MGDSAVHVAVRSRPLLPGEEESVSSIRFFPGQTHVCLNDKVFAFDYVFQPEMTNEDVYNASVADKLSYIFEGYNVSILAYGQTGSGKTFTMGTNYASSQITEGPGLGIIPRCIRDIFLGADSRAKTADFIVKVSFLEVYNEDVLDLLSKSKSTHPCSIREEPDGGIKVLNLTELEIHSAHEALEALEKGSYFRSTAATAMNEKSSRSHAIFCVILEQKNRESLKSTKSKFQLVDLAGSERAERCKTVGDRFREGVNINKSLLALGNVINALCVEKSHVPYRDSKLTRLLMDCLGGNSYTLMIACVSPSALSTEETLNTLRYADRARSIKNKPKVNIDPVEMQLLELRKQVHLLQSQLFEARNASNIDLTRRAEDGTVELRVANTNLRNHLKSSLSRVALLEQKLIETELREEELRKNIKALKEDLLVYFEEMYDNQPLNGVHKTLSTHNWILEKCASVLEMGSFGTTVLSDDFQVCQEEDQKLSETQRNISDSKDPSEAQLDDEFQMNGGELDDIEGEESDDVTQKKIAIDQQLEDLERKLSMNKDLAEHLEILCKVFDFNEFSEENLNSMITKVNVLVQERAKLEEALKISEERLKSERQKKYEEYELEIKKLEKQICRSKIFINMKEQNRKKINDLMSEIQKQKKARVQLSKRMRDDYSNFNRAISAKEREVTLLKKLDRKRDFEISKLKNRFERQVTVFKQRIEKTAALNKKLNLALQQQKTLRSEKPKDKKSAGFSVAHLVNHELEVAIYSKLAEDQYKNAKENAEALTEQYRNIQVSSEKIGNTATDYLAVMLDAEKRHLSELECTKRDDGNSGDRWSPINCMADAKTAITLLFEKTITAELNGARQKEMSDQLLEEQTSIKETYNSKIEKLNAEVNSLKEEMRTLRNNHENEIWKLRCESEAKNLELLRELNWYQKVPSTSISCSDEKELKQSQITPKDCEKSKWMPDIGLLSSLETYAVSSSETTTVSENEKLGQSMVEAYLTDPGEESLVSENDQNDPDWRATPVHKQRKRTIHTSRINKLDLEVAESLDNSIIPVKRQRSFSHCVCVGNCKTMRCGCKKKHLACSASCFCNKEKCSNLFKDNE